MNLIRKPATPKSLDLFIGNRNDNPAQWTAFDWDDPIHGPQVEGELIVIRPEGSSGSLMAGLWRTSPISPGCRPDGSSTIVYSAPLGDETVLILEGETEVTVTKTGKKHRLKAGDIMSHPKGLDVTWEVAGPFLKKMWVIWDSPEVANSAEDVYVGNTTGTVDGWIPFEWEEPLRGLSREGEIQVIRDVGATGTLICGLWRTSLTSPARAADGSSELWYSAPLGDETFMLIEGEAVLTVTATGQRHHIRAGDIVGQPKNLELHWSIRSPYLKKFWVITDARRPAA